MKKTLIIIIILILTPNFLFSEDYQSNINSNTTIYNLFGTNKLDYTSRKKQKANRTRKEEKSNYYFSFGTGIGMSYGVLGQKIEFSTDNFAANFSFNLFASESNDLPETKSFGAKIYSYLLF